ncbi:zinc finger MYM-type protein 1-like, partial [Aphis craccivora]
MLYLEKYPSSEIHPDDPVNEIPTIQTEFRQRVKNGPFQPILKSYPNTAFSGTLRHFQSHWYKQFPWLEYSQIRDLAYFFPCRMFTHSSGINIGQTELTYSKSGFKNWKLATSKFKLHQMSKVHLNSSTSLNNFLNLKPIDIILDENRELLHSGKPFRGHSEKSNDIHKGLFLDIVGLLKKYDPILNEHLNSGPKNALYCNKKISLISDETSDLGHHEQLSIVIRYFDDTKCSAVEQFLTMKRIKSVNTQSIFNTLSDVIEEYNIKWENIVSTCFDGAATMAGSTAGVQNKFKEKNKNIFFVHCYGHCLNLILVDSVGCKNRIALDFFGTIQLVYNFIEGSCSRHAIFEQIVNSTNAKLKTLKSLSNTRWACRSEAVSAVKINYSSLLVAIEEIINSTKQSEVRVKGLGIMYQLKKFEFIFALEMFHPILSAVLKVSTFLQTSNINLLTAVEVEDSLKESLKKMRNEEYEFQKIYKNTVKLCSDIDIQIPAAKKRKISSKVDTSHTSQYFFKTKEEEMKLIVYNTALDQMINGISIRFNQETINMIKSIANLIILQTNDEDICTLASSF